MKKFGENLETIMQKNNLSARELSRRLGLPQKTVAEWVGANGRLPRNVDALKKLAECFNCSVHFLLFGEEDQRFSIENMLSKTEVHTALYEISIKKVNRE
ncbi:MAG: helix-turn-helix transcriptional regulator [Bdellovibrionota bacterium]